MAGQFHHSLDIDGFDSVDPVGSSRGHRQL